MGSVRTRTILFHRLSRSPAPLSTSAAASPSCLRVLVPPEHAGTWRATLLSFTVFLFSPELLSLLESNESSVAVDLCLNFCSQLSGFLLLWG